jgi:hypothetical protein
VALVRRRECVPNSCGSRPIRAIQLETRREFAGLRCSGLAGRGSQTGSRQAASVPDHKTIADFRKDNGKAIGQVCARFVELCRQMGLLATTSVAIDGSKFKAVNNRDRNVTHGKVERRRAQLEESVARYLSQLDTADRHEPTEALARKTERLKEKLVKLKEEMAKLATIEAQMLASPDQQVSLTDPDSRSMATSGRGWRLRGSRRGSCFCSGLSSARCGMLKEKTNHFATGIWAARFSV